jgi:Domain of unknown function (DUF4129)
MHTPNAIHPAIVSIVRAQPPIDIGRDDARKLAQDELSKPDYQQLQPSLWQRFTSWLSDHLNRLIDSSHHGLNGLWAGLVLAIIIVAVVLLVLRALGKPVRSRYSAPQVFGDATMTAAAHRALADTHAAAGRWDDAVIERMRAVVRELEERGYIDVRPGRTADEAANDAGRVLPLLANDLRAGARTFDDICYGKLPAASNHDAQLQALDNAVTHTRESIAR